jgi:hypothetical protein
VEAGFARLSLVGSNRHLDVSLPALFCAIHQTAKSVCIMTIGSSMMPSPMRMLFIMPLFLRMPIQA